MHNKYQRKTTRAKKEYAPDKFDMHYDTCCAHV